jgi:predicted ribosome quality control (RQC) complex YloA/Tae2 family protein
MIPDKVIQDWAKNKKRIQDRLNRIKKRIKKFQKQEKHFEMRLRAIQKHEKESGKKESSQDSAQNPNGLSGESLREAVSQTGPQSDQKA